MITELLASLLIGFLELICYINVMNSYLGVMGMKVKKAQVLLVNVDETVAEQVMSLANLKFRDAFQFKDVKIGDHQIDYLKSLCFSTIIVSKLKDKDTIVDCLMENNCEFNHVKLVIIDSRYDYISIRNAFKSGVLDYWVKPVNIHFIEEALQEVMDNTTLEAYNDSGYKISRAIIHGDLIDDYEMEFYYETFMGHVSRDYELRQAFYDALLGILHHVSFEPMILKQDFVANMAANWIVEQDKDLEAFKLVIEYISRVYYDIFLPKIKVAFVRQAIYEALKASSEDKTVGNIARKLYVNQSHLSVTFKVNTGISLSSYIRRVKMYGSMILLLDSSSSLDYILNLLSYRDEKHFSRIFKKHSGVTPTVFRQSYKKIYYKKK